MKNTEFAVNSKVRVVNRGSDYFRFRGTISKEIADGETHAGWKCRLTKAADGSGCDFLADFLDSEIVNVQKKFIDIEHIRESDVIVGKGSDGSDVVRKGNTGAFRPGDRIVIQQKIDGANASVSYNAEDGRLEAFSRTNLLDGVDGLRGFKQYVDTRLDLEKFKDPDLVFFGEWLVPHTCVYDGDKYQKWYVYDVWSKSRRNYLQQDDVRRLCSENGLTYVEPLYDGPFVSWDHVRSFMRVNPFGKQQEGVVCKSQAKLSDDELRFPKYLKIVNEEFKESARIKPKREVDPEKRKELGRSKELIASVVTEARVRKQIMKLVDEGAIPASLTPKCMGAVMKRVPAAVWNDILKEEMETVRAAGDSASKFCSAVTAEIARKLILGR